MTLQQLYNLLIPYIQYHHLLQAFLSLLTHEEVNDLIQALGFHCHPCLSTSHLTLPEQMQCMIQKAADQLQEDGRINPLRGSLTGSFSWNFLIMEQHDSIHPFHPIAMAALSVLEWTQECKATLMDEGIITRSN
ncbi:hypothetical protein P691DRAFT_769340 [Macrolepiota fuliginosa MF-IS2]|uniref:Uncharacterized protein n=1 Tax=Macrolepiota fuliginosa MF-IS2 TaxID=1400762 RepID=A0A9P6BUS7_9AGAR|nr:hypothetical protein P691DRAFT_769340 [Macrolepiota fuliginosa MF-IS2]